MALLREVVVGKSVLAGDLSDKIFSESYSIDVILAGFQVSHLRKPLHDYPNSIEVL